MKENTKGRLGYGQKKWLGTELGLVRVVTEEQKLLKDKEIHIWRMGRWPQMGTDQGRFSKQQQAGSGIHASLWHPQQQAHRALPSTAVPGTVLS